MPPHHSEYEPGQRVRHPAQPGWGLGQIQSVVGDRVTVNFEHAGKVLVNVAVAPLAILDDPPFLDDTRPETG